MNIRRIIVVFAVVLVPLALSALEKQECRFTVTNKTDTTIFINVDGTDEALYGYKDGHDVCDMKPGESCTFVENQSCHTLHALADMGIGAVTIATRKVSDCRLDSYAWSVPEKDPR